MESRKEDATSNEIDCLENKEDLELAKAAQRCLVSALDHSRAVQIAVLEEGTQELGDAPLLRCRRMCCACLPMSWALWRKVKPSRHAQGT